MLRVHILNVIITEFGNYVKWWMCSLFFNILQYIGVSKHHIVYLKFPTYMSIIPPWCWGKRDYGVNLTTHVLVILYIITLQIYSGVNFSLYCQTGDDFKIKGMKNYDCFTLCWFHSFTCEMLKCWKCCRRKQLRTILPRLL